MHFLFFFSDGFNQFKENDWHNIVGRYRYIYDTLKMCTYHNLITFCLRGSDYNLQHCLICKINRIHAHLTLLISKDCFFSLVLYSCFTSCSFSFSVETFSHWNFMSRKFSSILLYSIFFFIFVLLILCRLFGYLPCCYCNTLFYLMINVSFFYF